MPQVSVTIAGRTYRMACGEGEDAHLEAMAAMLDHRIAKLREDFGEIGDQRIIVMAAITLADDLSEAHKRIAALEADKARLEDDVEAMARRLEAMGEAVAAALDGAATGIDQMAKHLATPANP